MPINTTDEEWVKAIQSDKAAREDALAFFFKHSTLRKTVFDYVRSNDGSDADAKDVFQDTLILFDRNIRAGKFQAKSTLFTYFIGIAKWRWLALKRQKSKTESTNHFAEIEIQGVDYQYFEKEKKELLESVLRQIGEKCKTLLTYYKLSYSMEEIAQQYGLSSAEMAKKETYRCREKLKNYLNQHPQLLQNLK
jgi:RNA polymerase sigma factor (sigma-70 family)